MTFSDVLQAEVFWQDVCFRGDYGEEEDVLGVRNSHDAGHVLLSWGGFINAVNRE